MKLGVLVPAGPIGHLAAATAAFQATAVTTQNNAQAVALAVAVLLKLQ